MSSPIPTSSTQLPYRRTAPPIIARPVASGCLDSGPDRRRLLFHSYHFPPIGGSGAQRPLRMARFLQKLGWDQVVVTGGGATADRWAPEDEI